MSKVAIIGAGRVGMTSAYSIVMSNAVDELVLLDINETLLRGEELDLKPCAYFNRPVKITCTTDYSHAKDADVVVITAGVARKADESRLDLIRKNLGIMKGICDKIVKQAPNAVYVIVSNPVDILTYFFIKHSGLPKNQVFGSGTSIDTARLSSIMADEYKVHPQYIDAYILGEHGDSSFVAWSAAKIKGVQLKKVPNYNQARIDLFLDDVRKMGAEIIAKKAATYYSIGIVVSEIVAAILSNASRVMPVSVLLDNYEGASDVCQSVPCVVNSYGVQQLPVSLDEKEKDAFRKSADELKKIINQVS